MPRPFAFFSPARIRPVLLGTCALVLLSGCQGGGSPAAPPSESPTTSPPASSAPAPSSPPATSTAYKPADAKGRAQNVPVPVMPALAKENSKAGLEAFIRYWYALGNYANETGDVSKLSTLSTQQCQSCLYFQKAATDGHINGRWLVGGTVTLPSIQINWNQAETNHQATIQVIQDAISYYNADGTEGRPMDPPSNDAFVVIAKYEAEWKVVDTGVIR